MDHEIEKLRKRADQLEKLKSEFPDLREYGDRWEKILISKQVKPEKYSLKHSCGCCDDSPLLMYFYVERHGERVYTDPPYVRVGEKNRNYGEEGEPIDIWYPGWKLDVTKAYGEEVLALLPDFRRNQ